MMLLRLRGLTALLALCCFNAFAAAAASDDALAAAGDRAYLRRAWDSAAHYYERASAGGNAIALYKLGNAEYRRRHNGEAVLAWCRALKAQPGFAAAQNNIRTVQESLKLGAQHGKDAALVTWWRSFIRPEASNQWALMSLLLFSLMTGTLAWRRFQRKPPVRRSFIISLTGAGLLCAGMALYAAYGSVPRAAAVVMHADTLMQPDVKGGSVLSLPEGLLVQVTSEGSNIHILLPDGRRGVVQLTDIALVR